MKKCLDNWNFKVKVIHESKWSRLPPPYKSEAFRCLYRHRTGTAWYLDDNFTSDGASTVPARSPLKSEGFLKYGHRPIQEHAFQAPSGDWTTYVLPVSDLPGFSTHSLLSSTQTSTVAVRWTKFSAATGAVRFCLISAVFHLWMWHKVTSKCSCLLSV